MLRQLSSYLARLDSVYQHGAFFVGLKARLLAGMTLVVLAFVPLNIVKTLWVDPPLVLLRIVVNLAIGIAAAFCLRELFKGRLARAGSGLVLTMILAVHLTVLIAGTIVQPRQPIGMGIQLLAFDFVFLLFAFIFTSRLFAGV